MFRSWHGLFLIFSSTLTLLVMASMAHSGRIAREGAEIVEHTNVVIGTFLELRSVISEAESMVRGNVIAGEILTDAPLQKAEVESARLLDHLTVLTKDNASQQKLLQAARPLVNERLASLRRLISIKQGRDGEEARRKSIVLGNDIMRRLLNTLSEGIQHERDLYAHRDKELAREFEKQTFTSFGGLILAVATGLASLLLLLRSHRQLLHTFEMEKAASRAQEADLQKSQFLANMSHEIRTPMNAILGFTDLLSGMVTEPRARKYLDSIQSSGRSLLELINEILDISRVEAGKLELRTEPTNVREVVEGVALMLKKQAQDKGISLETKVSGAMPPLLEIDALRLRQITLNLVTNAVKFTHRGGVKVMLVANALNENRWDMTIKVTDTGVGISKEDRARIFSPFEQVSTQSRSGAQGSGLGLSITQKLVDLMGGTIEFESTPGVGSEFTVTFTDIAVSQKDADPPSERSADFNQLRPAAILVVDDNSTNRELLAGFFHGSHHELFFAQDGMEALEVARHAKPDVILMDIRMPRMDGKWARQILLEDERTRSIPVIAQTASSVPEEAGRLKQMFNGYLRKPFSPRQLYKELEPVIGHSTLKHVAARPAKPVADDMPASLIEALDEHTSASWPGLAARLGEIARKDIARYRDSCPMREIAECGAEIQLLAARHDCPPLSRYASALTAAAESFEVEQVEKLLSEFETVAERITGVPVHPPA